MQKTITTCDLCGMEYTPKALRLKIGVGCQDNSGERRRHVAFDLQTQRTQLDICHVCLDNAYIDAMRSVIMPKVNGFDGDPVLFYAKRLEESLEKSEKGYDARMMQWLTMLIKTHNT